MKKNIHPKKFRANAICACGSTFMTESTIKEIKSTYCSACHPFFTGEQKFVDSAGRIEKFNKKYSPSKK